MEFENLPTKILERIFSKLPNEELLNLSLVCRKLNKIISTSSVILHNFELLITDYEVRKWIGTRKYQKIYIEDCRRDHLLEHTNVFQSIHDSVIEVAIRKLIEMDIEDFARFMNQFANITKVNIFSVELYENNSTDQKYEPVNLKFLKYLTFCQSDVRLLKLFENSQLIFLKISDDYGGKEILADFLVNQRCLETLELSYFEGASNIFNNKKILKIKFRLKKLVIDEEKLDDSVFENLHKFLNIHKETLEYFEVYEENYEIVKYLRDFLNLKTFRIFGGSDTIEVKLPQMENIENLHIESKIDNFHCIFPNLISLKTSTHFIDLSSIDKLQKLQNLEVNNFWDIPIFHNRNLKSVKLVNCSFQHVGKFTFDGNKLESLTIENCYFVDWLKDFLLHKDQKLKLLKIFNMQLEQNQLTQELVNAVNNVKYKIHTVISPFCK